VLNLRKRAAWPPGPETGGTTPDTKYTFEFDIGIRIPEGTVPDVQQSIDQQGIKFDHPGIQDQTQSAIETVKGMLGPDAEEVSGGGGFGFRDTQIRVPNLTESESFALGEKVREYFNSLGMTQKDSEFAGDYYFSVWNVDDPQHYMDDENDLVGIENFNNRYSSARPIRKKAGYTYTAELLSAMTQNLDRLSANYTADGVEAVVNFTSSEAQDQEPQQYHIKITPISIIEGRQEAENPSEGYSWGPEGPPPGIANAVKLNMKKKALEIGGETFPDVLKFKEDSIPEANLEESALDVYGKAENFIINYIWRGLQVQGIIGPDDINVVQTDVDEVQFNSASSLINQLMEEGWFKFLEQSSSEQLKADPDLQQKIYNAIKTAIKEGVV